jgi:hypothetical protein
VSPALIVPGDLDGRLVAEESDDGLDDDLEVEQD